MNNLAKKIIELKELRKKATAGPLGVKNGVVYALNNDHTPAISNTGALMRVLSGREADADLYFATHNYLPELLKTVESMDELLAESFKRSSELLKEREAAIARAEKAEAMRDVLAKKLESITEMPPTLFQRRVSKAEWIEYAAQEVAKREEEV